jgi:hypothetical protein
MSVLNVAIGTAEVLDGTTLTGGIFREGIELYGPKRTLEGGLYYWTGREPRQEIRSVKADRLRVQATAADPTQHILRWSMFSDGLYKVAIDGSDSVRLFNERRPAGFTESDFDATGDLVVYHGWIRSLVDSIKIKLERGNQDMA